MVNIHVSYTAPVNPAGSSPVLTSSQLWKGLQRKVRYAHEFVPAIVECEVLEEMDEGRELLRQVKFKEDARLVKERCVEFEPIRVDFHQENGSIITNVISDGPNGTDSDRYMTYIFEWKHPGVEKESAEFKDLRNKHKEMAKMAVDKSIESIRKFVEAGVIQ